MTKDHLVEEKTSLQKSLLYYESQHGRPVMLGFISNSAINVCMDSSNSWAIVRPELNAGVGLLLFPSPKHKGICWPPCCHLRNLLHWLLKKEKKYVLIGPLFRNQQVIGVCKVMSFGALYVCEAKRCLKNKQDYWISSEKTRNVVLDFTETEMKGQFPLPFSTVSSFSFFPFISVEPSSLPGTHLFPHFLVPFLPLFHGYLNTGFACAEAPLIFRNHLNLFPEKYTILKWERMKKHPVIPFYLHKPPFMHTV